MKYFTKIISYADSFFWGLVAGFTALIAEVFLDTVFSAASEAWSSANTAVFVVFGVLIEELSKFFVIKLRLSRENQVVLRSLTFGLGFAALELALMNRVQASGSYPEIFAVHTAAAGIIGWFFSKKMPAVGLIIAFALHLAYNLYVLNFRP